MGTSPTSASGAGSGRCTLRRYEGRALTEVAMQAASRPGFLRKCREEHGKERRPFTTPELVDTADSPMKTLGMVQMDLTVSCNLIVIRAASNGVRNCFRTVQTVKFD